jgi:hypothetical protein
MKTCFAGDSLIYGPSEIDTLTLPGASVSC